MITDKAKEEAHIQLLDYVETRLSAFRSLAVNRFYYTEKRKEIAEGIISRIRTEALKEAAERAREEKEKGNDKGDYVYNLGIDDAIRAILSDAAPVEETE